MHNSFEELCAAHKVVCKNNECCINNRFAIEKGKRFEIVSNESFTKIRIDNCLITSQQFKKCDFGFIRNLNEDFYFVELKGSDIGHAYEQIVKTIGIFHQEIIQIPQSKRHGFIVSSKVPKAGVDINNLKQDFAKKFGKKLEVKNKELKYIPE